MQSLQQITAKRLLSLLPEPCFKILAETYMSNNKSYHLPSFIEVNLDELANLQREWWYFIFNHRKFLTACSSHQVNIYQDSDTYKIYCLPRSGWNEVFYSYDLTLSSSSTLYSTLREPPSTTIAFHTYLMQDRYVYSIWNEKKSLPAARYFIP